MGSDEDEEEEEEEEAGSVLGSLPFGNYVNFHALKPRVGEVVLAISQSTGLVTYLQHRCCSQEL